MGKNWSQKPTSKDQRPIRQSSKNKAKIQTTQKAKAKKEKKVAIRILT
jgi:hypothetical protein